MHADAVHEINMLPFGMETYAMMQRGEYFASSSVERRQREERKANIEEREVIMEIGFQKLCLIEN